MSPSEAEAAVEVVLVTVPDEKTGRHIARTLVAERRAACVNLLPGVHSVYRWKGEVEEASELLLVIKTREDRSADLEARVLELHPYEVAEVLRLPVSGGNPAYLDWLREMAAP